MPKYTFLLWEKAPHLLDEWHCRNSSNFNDTHAYSYKKVWWKGRCGHEWQAVVYSRTQGAGCPYCQGLLVTDKNSLSKLYPHLALEWHHDKNTMLLDDMTKSSGKKVWWLGKCGHEWQARIADRTYGIGTGCPYCLNRLINKDNSLAVIAPTVSKEWHQFKNMPLTPYDVAPRSHKKVWWICNQCGNEWQATINNRNKKIKPTGCPACMALHFKRQRLIYDQIKLIYPDLKIKYNYKHPDLRFKNTNAKMELDIFIPKLKLAIEYQGEYHFLPIVGQDALIKTQDRDKEKREICAKYNINLLEIDYTWNGDFRVVEDLLKIYR